MPTILELTGIAAADVDGESLVPWLRADRLPRPVKWSYALSQTSEHGGARSLRTRDWSLVHRHRTGWRLFDLRSDPFELQDVKAEHPQVVDRLRPLLAELSSESAHESASTKAQPDQETLDRLRALGYVD